MKSKLRQKGSANQTRELQQLCIKKTGTPRRSCCLHYTTR